MAKKIKADDENLQELISEDGYFVVSKKSIRWGIGILSMVLMTLWGSLQYSVQQANNKTDETTKALTELVEVLEKEEIEPLENKVQQMEITDAVLLERTNSRASNTGSNGNLPNNGQPPTSSGPPTH